MAKRRGPKSKYSSAYHDKLVEAFSELGLTDLEMAKKFGVARSTFSLWKEKHPKFVKALKRGKEVADQIVEQSLYKRACGYEHPQDKIFCTDGEVTTVKTIKHYPPDTGACFIWLKNRAGWRDKQEVVHSFDWRTLTKDGSDSDTNEGTESKDT